MLPADLSRNAVTAWFAAQPAELIRIVRILSQSEGWITGAAEESWDDLAEILSGVDAGAIRLADDDAFLDSLRVTLAHCGAVDRLRALVWFAEGGNDREKLANALVNADRAPTSEEARIAFDTLLGFMGQVKRRLVFERVFSPKRLEQLVQAAQRADA